MSTSSPPPSPPPAPPPPTEADRAPSPPAPVTGWELPLRPLPTPTRLVAVLAVGVALVANVALRLPVPTVALALTLVGSLVLVGLGRGLGSEPRAWSRIDRVAAVLIVILAGLLVVRTSPWVVATSLVAVAALLASLGSGGFRLDHPRPWAGTVYRGAESLFDGVRWLPDLTEAATGTSRSRLGPPLRALAVVVVVVAVLVPILASGDAVFASVVTSLGPSSALSHLVLTAILIVPAVACALLPHGGPGPTAVPFPGSPLTTEARAGVWATAAVLTAWCTVQVWVVLGGAEAVLEAEGLTPAHYAREGFFQLVWAAGISLAVVNLAQRLARSQDPDAGFAPDRAQRVPATIIGVALLALTAASFSRLWYYMEVFGLTMLRLAVATFLVWLAAMAALSMARALGVGSDHNWFPAAALVSAAVAAMVFAGINPEARVAQVNLDRALVSDQVDLRYLTRELGYDAEPVVDAYDWDEIGGRPDEIDYWLCQDPDESLGFGPLGWNLSHWRAQSIGGSCDRPTPAANRD